MFGALYSSASAMDSAAAQHEVVASNLAHAQMPGFRRSEVVHASFEATLRESMGVAYGRERLGVGPGEVRIDFTPGPVVETGRPLDMTLSGDAFFAIEGPTGPLYTRNGAFQIDDQGQLVTADGLPVRTPGGGAINLPPTASTTTLTVSREGAVFVDGVQLGQLEIVRFEDRSGLRAVGASLFDAGADVAQPSDAMVFQGRRELSNVHPVEELVRMITSLRHYEAAQRSIHSVDRVLEKQLEL